MITQTYPLSLQPGGIPVRVPCVQGDVQSRTLQFQLTSSGASANLPAGAGVTLEGTKPDGKSFSVAGTLSDDVAEITLTAQMTAVSGEIPCRLNITSGSKILGTGQLLLEVAPSALPADPDLSDSDISLLTQLKNTVNQFSAAKADKKTPSAAQNVALLDAGGNLMDSGKQLTAASIGEILGISSGSWTPTLSGMSSYSYQRGRYFKIGDIAIVSFSIWGTMAGSNTEQIKVSGCPLTPAAEGYSGGGYLSGYYAANDTIFTSWTASTDGSFYAYGQIPGSGNKWGSSEIFQKTSGECGGGGTIMFKTTS